MSVNTELMSVSEWGAPFDCKKWGYHFEWEINLLMMQMNVTQSSDVCHTHGCMVVTQRLRLVKLN